MVTGKGTPRDAGRVSLPGEDPNELEKLVGVTLDDRYRLDRLLGTGGMGSVFEAQQIVLEKKMAIKVLHPRLARDQTHVKRFLREARATSTIRHRNIVDVVDFGRIEGFSVYIVMEFLEGTDLARIVARHGRLSWDRTRRITVQVLHALRAAHAKRIVHRDMKPANCLIVQEDGEVDHVKVLDFGIAKVAASAETGELTRADEVIGTPAYMAPEQALGKAIDARTDLYAVGVMMYHMLTGKVPFNGTSAFDVLSRHCNETPPPMREQVADLPPGVEHIVMKALEKNPGDRFQNATEFEAAIDAFEARRAPSATFPVVSVDDSATTAQLPSMRAPVGSTQPLGATLGAVPTPTAVLPSESAVATAVHRKKFESARTGFGTTIMAGTPAAVPGNTLVAPVERGDPAKLAAEIQGPGTIPGGRDPTDSDLAGWTERNSKRGRLLGITLGFVVVVAASAGLGWTLTHRDEPVVEPLAVREPVQEAAPAVPPPVDYGDFAHAPDPEPSDTPTPEVAVEVPRQAEPPDEVVSTEVEAESEDEGEPEPEPESGPAVEDPPEPKPVATKRPGGSKPGTHTDASVKAKLRQRARSRCGSGVVGDEVTVRFSISSSGSTMLVKPQPPNQHTRAGKCVAELVAGTSFPPTGKMRAATLDVRFR